MLIHTYDHVIVRPRAASLLASSAAGNLTYRQLQPRPDYGAAHRYGEWHAVAETGEYNGAGGWGVAFHRGTTDAGGAIAQG